MFPLHCRWPRPFGVSTFVCKSCCCFHSFLKLSIKSSVRKMWNSEAWELEVFLSELFSGRINIWIVHEWIAANHHFTSKREITLLSAMFFTLPWKSALVSGIMGLSSQRKTFFSLVLKAEVSLGVLGDQAQKIEKENCSTAVTLTCDTFDTFHRKLRPKVLFVVRIYYTHKHSHSSSAPVSVLTVCISENSLQSLTDVALKCLQAECNGRKWHTRLSEIFWNANRGH